MSVAKLSGRNCGKLIKEALGTDLEVEIHSEQPNITTIWLGRFQALASKHKWNSKKSRSQRYSQLESLSFNLLYKTSTLAGGPLAVFPLYKL